MSPWPLVIDCDPGLDDAVAIALAAAAPELALRAITTVAGNAAVEVTTQNALGVVAALGLEVPVLAGCAKPMQLPLRTSVSLWGGDGDLRLPASGWTVGGTHAVPALVDLLEAAAEGEVTLCPIGPLTNIARVLAMRPDLASRIRELVIMGGAIGPGNATPQAELNIWVDPHAAHAVFASRVPIVLATLDATRPLVAPAEALAALAASRTPAARLASRLLPLAGKDSHPSSIYDAATVGWLLWPELFRLRTGRVAVDLEPGEMQGRTRFIEEAGGPHRVLASIDRDAFFRRFVQTLANES